MKKTTYVALGVVLTFIIMLVVFGYIITGNKQIKNLANFSLLGKKQNSKSAFELKISTVAENSFGTLSANSASPTTKDSALASPVPLLNQGSVQTGTGGGGVAVGSNGAMMQKESAISRIMPPYEQTTIKYSYKGGDIKVESDKMDVLKRIKGVDSGINASAIASSLNFGVADLSTFPNLYLQNITFTQKGDFSYLISVMLDEGSVSISQNWENWPMGKCLDDAKCYQAQIVKSGDIPTDEEMIGIANAFIAEHGIDTKQYGEPEVANYWKAEYERATDKANFYFPDSMDVIYPLKINGKFVYDEWSGMKQGMNVSVQIKTRKVSNVYNINTQNYESSAYEVETDAKILIELAEKGGQNFHYLMNEEMQAKNIEVDLGDPEIGYMKYWSYKNNKSEELLVPAMVFPFKNMPSGADIYKKGIVVPLVKDIIKERQAADNGLNPVPTPMMLKTDSSISVPDAISGGSSSGSGTSGSEPSAPSLMNR